MLNGRYVFLLRHVSSLKHLSIIHFLNETRICQQTCSIYHERIKDCQSRGTHDPVQDWEVPFFERLNLSSCRRILWWGRQFSHNGRMRRGNEISGDTIDLSESTVTISGAEDRLDGRTALTFPLNTPMPFNISFHLSSRMLSSWTWKTGLPFSFLLHQVGWGLKLKKGPFLY